MTPRPEGWHRGIMRRKSSPCRHNTLYCRTPSLRGTGAGTDGAPGVGPLLRGGRIGTVPILRVPRPARTNERPRRTERAGTGDGPGDEGAGERAGVAWSESRWITLPRARRPATGPTDASDPGRLSAADRAATVSKEDRTAEGPAGQAWDRKGRRIRAGRWRSPSASRGRSRSDPVDPGPRMNGGSPAESGPQEGGRGAESEMSPSFAAPAVSTPPEERAVISVGGGFGRVTSRPHRRVHVQSHESPRAL